MNTFSLYGHDSLQLTKRLSANHGVRYDYEGPVHSGYPNLSVFDPAKPSGLTVAGQDVANIYNRFWKSVSPRVGVACKLDNTGKMVLRAGYGFYGDSIFMKPILQNDEVQNISVFGPQYNPAGSQTVAQSDGLDAVIQSGQAIFQRYANALSSQGTVKIDVYAAEFVYAVSANMPEWAKITPAKYWKAADLYKRANGRLFQSMEIALPLRLSRKQQSLLAEKFASELATTKHGVLLCLGIYLAPPDPSG